MAVVGVGESEGGLVWVSDFDVAFCQGDVDGFSVVLFDGYWFFLYGGVICEVVVDELHGCCSHSCVLSRIICMRLWLGLVISMAW